MLPRSTEVHAWWLWALGREQMLGLIRAWLLWPTTAEDIQIKRDTCAQCIMWTTLLPDQPMWRGLRVAASYKQCALNVVFWNQSPSQEDTAPPMCRGQEASSTVGVWRERFSVYGFPVFINPHQEIVNFFLRIVLPADLKLARLGPLPKMDPNPRNSIELY